jgi:enoyl-CoA hydratase/carnithine racemase
MLSPTGQAVADAYELDSAESRGDAIVVGRKGHVGLVLLDRPEVGNAHNRAMIRALGETWVEFAGDSNIRCMVMSSSTPKYFCTGIDLKEVAGTGYGDGTDKVRGSGQTHRDARVLKPMIAAVEGLVLGGGLHWVVEADIVVAAETARFVDTHVAVGLVGNRENLGVALKAGLGAALYLSLVGKDVELDARRAMELGMVQEVVAPGESLRRALSLAEIICRHSPSAMANELRTLWAISTMHYEEAIKFGWELLEKQRFHPDASEGPRAFAERRPANWVVD